MSQTAMRVDVLDIEVLAERRTEKRADEVKKKFLLRKLEV